MAIVGRGSAIADWAGSRFSGLLAWLAWLFLHIFKLIGFRNRLVVLLEWAVAYLTFQRSVRLITYQEQELGPGFATPTEVGEGGVGMQSGAFFGGSDGVSGVRGDGPAIRRVGPDNGRKYRTKRP